MAIGLHIGGNIETFAEMMNQKAKELGLMNTSFANPHGLDNENHYTTAKEFALLTKYALQNKHINEVVSSKTATVDFGSYTKTLNNTNTLLHTYDKANGVKTGFTNGANRCLVASASNDTNRYIAVILGADTSKIRFQTAKDILEKCFETYTQMDISKYLNFYINIPITKGIIPFYERQISDHLSLPLTKEEYEKIYIKQDIVPTLTAPIQKGEKIGKISVLIDEEVLYEKELFLEETIRKKNVGDYILEGLKNLFAPIEKV